MCRIRYSEQGSRCYRPTTSRKNVRDVGVIVGILISRKVRSTPNNSLHGPPTSILCVQTTTTTLPSKQNQARKKRTWKRSETRMWSVGTPGERWTSSRRLFTAEPMIDVLHFWGAFRKNIQKTEQKHQGNDTKKLSARVSDSDRQ